MKVKIGDVVRLNSGGPKMTISEIDYVNNVAYCQWFTKDKEIKGYFFNIDVLKKVK